MSSPSSLALPVRLHPKQSLLPILIIVGAALFGLLVARDPRLVVAPLVPVVLYGLLVSPACRVAFIAIGGIVTLQGESGLTVPKIVYLLGFLVCVGLSLRGLIRSGVADQWKILTPVLQWTWLWTLLIGVSFYVAVSKNVPAVDWFRGAVPYLLFASVPIIVYDAANQRASERLYRIVLGCFVIAGILTTVSWFISWTTSRGYAQLGLERLFLWSFVLSTALFCYAVSAAYHSGRNRLGWLLVAAFVVAALSLTGTRQAVLLVIAPLIVLFSGGDKTLKKTARFGIGLLPVVVLGIVAIVFLSRSIDLDLSVVQERFASIGEITNDDAEGRSYQERVIQTELAREAFLANIWTGVSPGHRYEWLTTYAGIKYTFNIDSPLALPANFGLLGVGIAVVTFWNLRTFVTTLKARHAGVEVESDAIRAFSWIMVVYVLAGSPFEDKGLALAFMFLLSLAMIRLNFHAAAESAFAAPSIER